MMRGVGCLGAIPEGVALSVFLHRAAVLEWRGDGEGDLGRGKEA